MKSEKYKREAIRKNEFEIVYPELFMAISFTATRPKVM